MEDQADYITEALDLLHGEPSAEIEQPRAVTERRGGKLVEVERQAFVKLYTSFKKELREIDGDALKVWLFLALSVNRHTKDANPGLRTIAEETGMSVNTVRTKIEYLDGSGLLEIESRLGRHGNSYKPADYVSVERNVSNSDTLKNVSKNGGNVSNSDGNVSVTRRESAQLEELESTRTPAKRGDLLDGILDLTFKPKAVRDAFAKFFRLTPNWEAKYNRQFLEWAVEIGMTPEQVQRAADVWRSDKRFNWSVPTLKGIQEHWFELVEVKTDEERPEYKPIPERVGVPRPAHIPPPNIKRSRNDTANS